MPGVTLFFNYPPILSRSDCVRAPAGVRIARPAPHLSVLTRIFDPPFDTPACPPSLAQFAPVRVGLQGTIWVRSIITGLCASASEVTIEL